MNAGVRLIEHCIAHISAPRNLKYAAFVGNLYCGAIGDEGFSNFDRFGRSHWKAFSYLDSKRIVPRLLKIGQKQRSAVIDLGDLSDVVSHQFRIALRLAVRIHQGSILHVRPNLIQSAQIHGPSSWTVIELSWAIRVHNSHFLRKIRVTPRLVSRERAKYIRRKWAGPGEQLHAAMEMHGIGSGSEPARTTTICCSSYAEASTYFRTIFTSKRFGQSLPVTKSRLCTAS